MSKTHALAAELDPKESPTIGNILVFFYFIVTIKVIPYYDTGAL